MTIIEELDRIASKYVEMDIELPPKALLGVDKMKELQKEFYNKYQNSHGDNIGSVRVWQVYLSCGQITIEVSSKVSPDHISIGRMTMNDIIIEDILLDDEEFADFNNID